jgi:hypothetical protein
MRAGLKACPDAKSLGRIDDKGGGMCDYSLGGLPNRLAVEGEELIVHKFPTHSIGLASPADLKPKISEALVTDKGFWQRIKNFFTPETTSPNAPAVCVPPGACLILKGIPLDLQQKWSIGEEEGVLFSQISAEANAYRDAFCFRDGRLVLLQHVNEGIRVKVVSLGGDLVDEREPAVAVPNRPSV